MTVCLKIQGLNLFYMFFKPAASITCSDGDRPLGIPLRLEAFGF